MLSIRPSSFYLNKKKKKSLHTKDSCRTEHKQKAVVFGASQCVELYFYPISFVSYVTSFCNEIRTQNIETNTEKVLSKYEKFGSRNKPKTMQLFR